MGDRNLFDLEREFQELIPNMTVDNTESLRKEGKEEKE